ncbi:maltase 2 [Anabrus simplex]|uniref:maltase 2 n=1 Tax=Anabrus simplex TaxID=316456 RepID=UPI0035A3928A
MAPLVVILFLVFSIAGITAAPAKESDLDWWQSCVVYQIYPRSFRDSDGDGVGDLKGITEKLDYLVDLGVCAVWMSPIYKSPMVDFGYDISNYTEIDPIFGTMEDFEELRDRAHELGLKVIMDFVVSYTSDQMIWFQKSVRREDGYDDWYLWALGEKNESAPHGYNLPSNWLSAFRGSGWNWNEERQQFYFHTFTKEQPDLNYRDPGVVKAMKDVLRYWVDKGVDGFRVDAVPNMVEDINLHDELISGLVDDPDDYEYLTHIYTQHQPETYDMVQQWREVLDEYKGKDGHTRVMMTENYGPIDKVLQYYGTVERPGANFPFNFYLITNLDKNSRAHDFDRVIDMWLGNLQENNWPDWLLGNHDQHRVASRYGVEMADALNMLSLLLPGTAITYMGEELGMEDTDVSWQDTVDPWGINAGEANYKKYSRDPERTPFQWDDTTNAGFSSSNKTWLPVNSNYKTVNVETEKQATRSHYHVYKQLIELRKTRTIQRGSTYTLALTDNVFAFTRVLDSSDPVVVVINLGDVSETVNLSSLGSLPDALNVYASSIHSDYRPGVIVDTRALGLHPKEALVLTAS